MLCILYLNLVAAFLGVVALLIERALPSGVSRRWIWCAAIALTILIPMYTRTGHTWALPTPTAAVTAQAGIAERMSAISMTVFDPELWTAAESHDVTINRIWLISSATLVLWGAATAVRVSLIVHQSRRRRRRGESPAMLDGVPVVVTEGVGPATVGLLRSNVLVPRWVLALPAPQRRYVLRHEDEHRRANDARLLFAASLTLILLPWNLSLWWLLRRLRLAVEMDCDNRVVSALGDANAYGELLLKVAVASSRGPRLQPALLGVGELERRLKMLLSPTPMRRAQRYLLPALAIALLALVLSMPHPVLSHSAHSTHNVTPASVASSSPSR
jgi:beta-lactamase regulating signal transducer with metallopeptidase domain